MHQVKKDSSSLLTMPEKQRMRTLSTALVWKHYHIPPPPHSHTMSRLKTVWPNFVFTSKTTAVGYTLTLIAWMNSNWLLAVLMLMLKPYTYIYRQTVDKHKKIFINIIIRSSSINDLIVFIKLTFSNSIKAYCSDSFVLWSRITSQLQQTTSLST